MRLKIEQGRGYWPAAQREGSDGESRPIGRLRLDASFSPIERISYRVEARASNNAPTWTS